MRYVKGLGLVGVFLLGASLTVKADVWDAGTDNDNAFDTTDNHLVHGSDQIHDLAAQGGLADRDWFLIRHTPYSSFELVVDGITSQVDFTGSGVTRQNSGPGLAQNATLIDGGTSQSIAWQNVGATTTTGYILVNGAETACNTTCTANAQYRIRLAETTYSVPRFNNANGQITVLLVQNVRALPVAWTGNYWSVAGGLITQVPGNLASNQFAVVNLSTIPALQNQTGAITISHTAGYGGLAVKSVALEPATGFTFDTPGTYRSR